MNTERITEYHGITLEFEQVTPDKAKYWLENKNVGNRHVNLDRVKKYAKDMINGKWDIVPDLVAFYPDGNLANGQHRLSAIVKSGSTLMLPVMRNLPKSLNIDRQRVRSATDSLKISDKAHHKLVTTHVIAMCNTLLGYWNPHGAINYNDLEDFLVSEEPFLLDYVTEVGVGDRVRFLSSAQIRAAFYIAYRYGVKADILKNCRRALQTGGIYVFRI